MAQIIFGPAGLGGKDEAIDNLKKYHKLGIDACELSFTYSVYLKEADAKEIGKVAKDLGINLSIHGSYFINLNASEKAKVEASKKRILDACKIGHYLGAKCIVFHAGYYAKITPEETYKKIKLEIEDLLKTIKKNKWNVELCPEITGKPSVFGSIEEISKLSKETKCSFCIDFAHILARYKENNFELIKESFPQKYWHCHFSGIEYGEKGEKRHLKTKKSEWENLLDFLKTLDKKIVIVNESPDNVKDSIDGKKIFSKM